jgi:hypothetical protein
MFIACVSWRQACKLWEGLIREALLDYVLSGDNKEASQRMAAVAYFLGVLETMWQNRIKLTNSL